MPPTCVEWDSSTLMANDMSQTEFYEFLLLFWLKVVVLHNFRPPARILLKFWIIRCQSYNTFQILTRQDKRLRDCKVKITAKEMKGKMKPSFVRTHERSILMASTKTVLECMHYKYINVLLLWSDLIPDIIATSVKLTVVMIF